MSMRQERLLALLAGTAMLLSAGCSPAGQANDAPATIELLPQSLDFAAGEDARILTLKNTGGKGVSFSMQFTAESGGVKWREVESTAGSIEGGGSQSLLVRMVNRDILFAHNLPGNHPNRRTGPHHRAGTSDHGGGKADPLRRAGLTCSSTSTSTTGPSRFSSWEVCWCREAMHLRTSMPSMLTPRTQCSLARPPS